MAERASKRRKTSPSPDKVVDAARDGQGDLFIRAGPPASSVLLLTYSALLKCTSPVFKAMLGPNFSEGTSLHTKDHPLCLPDDDPTSFALLCKVLHHQYDTPKTFSRLIGLAVTADKYGCAKSIRPYFSSLLNPILRRDGVDAGGVAELSKKGLALPDAMCIAFIVGDAHLLWRTSKQVIASRDTSRLKETILKSLRDILPKTFIRHVCQSQNEQRDDFLVKIKQSGHRFLSSSVQSPCEKQIRLIGTVQFFIWQWKHGHTAGSGPGLTPTSSLKDAWSTVSDLADRCAKIIESRCSGGKKCLGCRQDPGREFRDIRRKSEAHLVGMCLECDQAGAIRKIEKKCAHNPGG